MTPEEAGMSAADTAAILEALGGGGEPGASAWQMGSDTARIQVNLPRSTLSSSVTASASVSANASSEQVQGEEEEEEKGSRLLHAGSDARATPGETLRKPD